jgi:flagellum-specific ATP synthase
LLNSYSFAEFSRFFASLLRRHASAYNGEISQGTPMLNSDLLPRPCSLADATAQIARLPRTIRWGQLESVRGASLIVSGFGRAAAIGDRVRVDTAHGPVPGEVVAFAGDTVTVMVEGRAEGLTSGARVVLTESSDLYPCGGWLGRVVDGSGQPLDFKGPLPQGKRAMKLRGVAPDAFGRRLMGARLETGIRVLDVFVPVCQGQRLGIFAA